MLPLRALVVMVCLGVSSVARADTPAEQMADAEREAAFHLLVEQGNQARLSGRYKDAALFYKMALDKQRHPVVSGRLGVVLVKLGQLDRAAEELHEAFEHGQGVSPRERREVAEAYDKAKTATTWVSVKISHAGATVTCDDQAWNQEKTSAFWRFVIPGEHTIRAKLDGYEDAVETITAKAGDEITVSLNFVPLAPKLAELPAPMASTPPEPHIFPPWLPSSNFAGDPGYDPREDPSYGERKETKPVPKKSGPRFSINGGVVTVFGVASWNPAVGGVVGVGLRLHENFSLGLEGRAAWLTTGVGGRQISAMTVGGNLSACGHVRWFFGCALGHIGTIEVTGSEQSYENEALSFVKPGFGGRLGADVHVASNFMLRPSVDVLGLRNGTRLVAGGEAIAEQPALLLSAQVTGGWEF